jgi:hypothetical protein
MLKAVRVIRPCFELNYQKNKFAEMGFIFSLGTGSSSEKDGKNNSEDSDTESEDSENDIEAAWRIFAANSIQVTHLFSDDQVFITPFRFVRQLPVPNSCSRLYCNMKWRWLTQYLRG